MSLKILSTPELWAAAEAGPVAIARETGWALMTTSIGSRWYITYLHFKSTDRLVRGEGATRIAALFEAACHALAANTEQAMLRSQVSKLLRGESL